MKVSDIFIWEQLGSLQGWSELAANCDASPFTWPSFCLPWWYEMGWGRLASVAVEESGFLVGLALVHDQVGNLGRHRCCFLGDGVGDYHQLLVADERHDVTALLWQRLLSSGREIHLSSVPTGIAQGYVAAAPDLLIPTDHTALGFVATPVDSVEFAPTTDIRSVRRVTSPAECIELLTGSPEAARWGGGVPGSRMQAFFESAVDASVRAGRMTLHVDDNHDGPVNGLLVLHGSGTSAVWRHVGRLGSGMDATLVQAAMAEAAERGSRRLVWPDSSGVQGQPFPLTDVNRVRPGGGRLRELSGLVRSAVRGF